MSSISTEYVIKRCKKLGFLRDYSQIARQCTEDQLENVLFITDIDETELKEKLSENEFPNAESINVH